MPGLGWKPVIWDGRLGSGIKWAMENADSISASEMVYRALRQAIVERVHLPGASLSRPELARVYRTSQTPVREALLRLEREGLVVVKPQAGTRVARIDIVALHQAQFLRRGVEENVVRRLAARGRRPDLLDRLAKEESTPETYLTLDRRFHRALFDAIGMGALFDTILPLMTPLERAMALEPATAERIAATKRDHDDILARIAANDPEGAARAMAAHLASDLQDLDGWRKAYPEMFGE